MEAGTCAGPSGGRSGRFTQLLSLLWVGLSIIVGCMKKLYKNNKCKSLGQSFVLQKQMKAQIISMMIYCQKLVIDQNLNNPACPGSVSEPKVTFVPTSTADGGVTLECKAECWYPEPKIMLLDDEGNELKAENPTRTSVSTECFTFTRRANVQTLINR